MPPIAANNIGKPVTTTQYNQVTPWGSVQDSAVQVSHTYSYGHPQGLLTVRETSVDALSDSDDPLQFQIGYEYDLWGNLFRTHYPRFGDGTCLPVAPPVVEHYWDPSGLLAINRCYDTDCSEVLLNGVSYDTATSMMTDWSTAVGFDDAPSYLDHKVEVDDTRARPTQIKASTVAGGTMFDTGLYDYDGVGNITGLAGSATTPGWSYSYDALNRLTGATRFPELPEEMKRGYEYDDLGNLRSRQYENSSTWNNVPVDATSNRLSSSAGYTYDDRGNLIQEPVGDWDRHLRFDPGNRVMSSWATGSTGEVPGAVFAFAYDSAGERVLRYRIAGGEVTDATFYLRDEAGKVLTEMLWAPTGVGTEGDMTRMKDYVYLGSKAVIRIEQSSFGSEYTSFITSFIHDHLGSTRAEVGVDGVSTAIEYWPFGELVNTPGLLSLETHMFTGHEREHVGTLSGVSPLEGLDYMHARYYSNNLGRFLSVDPMGGKVGISSSWNRYSYARNSPTARVDPDGKSDTVWGYTYIDYAWRSQDQIAAGTKTEEYGSEQRAFTTVGATAVLFNAPSPEDYAIAAGLKYAGRLLSRAGTAYRAWRVARQLRGVARYTDDVIDSSRAARGKTTEGARAIAKKLGHAEKGGYTSAFEGIKPTQTDAEKLINDSRLSISEGDL